MKKKSKTFKEKLTRPVGWEDVMLFSMWLTVFILGDVEKAFGLKLVEPFLLTVMGLGLGALAILLAGLVFYGKYMDKIDYFLNTPWWWKVSFLRNRKLEQVYQAINKKVFKGKMPVVAIKSTYGRNRTAVERQGDMLIETFIKGECVFSPKSRFVNSISIFGWFNQNELLTTMAHETAHAFQVYDKDCQVAHDSYFEQIYKYICLKCGIEPDMRYSREDTEKRQIVWTAEP
jgi:hypothetical protein